MIVSPTPGFWLSPVTAPTSSYSPRLVTVTSVVSVRRVRVVPLATSVATTVERINVVAVEVVRVLEVGRDGEGDDAVAVDGEVGAVRAGQRPGDPAFFVPGRVGRHGRRRVGVVRVVLVEG